MAQTSTLPVRPQSATARLSVQRAVRNYSFGFSALLAVGLLLANVATEHGGFGLTDQLANVAPVAIAAIASAPSIIGGGFDLSISPLICLTNCVFVVWLAPHGLGGAISVPIMLGLGLAVGALNGLLIIALRVQPIVVTLAMYFSLQGVDLLIAPNPVSLSSTGWVRHLAASVGPVPGGLLTIGIPMLIWVGLRFVPFRRLLYAVGSNDTTAFSSGVNVNAVRVASYALGGLFAGFGGLALTGLVSSADSSNATEYTLVAIAAVVLGGTPLVGGRGGLLGPLLGAFSIYLLQNLLATFAINPAYLQIVYGGILIVAVVLGGAVSREGGGGLLRPGMAWGRRRARATQPALAGASTLLPKREPTGEGRDPAAAGSSAAAAHSIPAAGRAERIRVARTRLGTLQARFPIFQVLALVAVFIYGDITLPGLGSWTSIRSILVLAALVGLASGGQTLLILIGGFDLGVSGFIVAGALTVTALRADYHLGFGLSLLLAVIGAGVLGGIAGYICHRFAINPLVVTLAMGTLAVGLVAVQNGGLVNGNAPQWLSTLAEPATRTFGLAIPPTIVIWAGALVLFAILLHRSKLGRSLFATGANSRAADYALISTRRVWTATFAFSAIASALVGVLIGGFAGTVNSALGDPYLFQSVVSVIVGGTVFGGPGDYTRTCVGALFLTVLTTVLVGHGASPAAEEIIYGLIILAAIAVYGRQRRLRDRL
ncbi:MAG TPA: ABC transporter permease [Streptosporangiaceae bacterium]|nr:ABC transporter permease [Streptosporangiaceae bacterium]